MCWGTRGWSGTIEAERAQAGLDGGGEAFDGEGVVDGEGFLEGALEGADADVEVAGEVGEDGVVVAGAGVESLFGDAVADGPVAFDEGLGGGAFGFLLAFADDAAEVAGECGVLGGG